MESRHRIDGGDGPSVVYPEWRTREEIMIEKCCEGRDNAVWPMHFDHANIRAHLERAAGDSRRILGKEHNS